MLLQQHEHNELRGEECAQHGASYQIAGQETRRLSRAERVRRQKAQGNPQSATLKVADSSVTENRLDGWKTLRGSPLWTSHTLPSTLLSAPLIGAMFSDCISHWEARFSGEP